MRQLVALILYCVGVAIVTVSLVNPRACRAGLETCILEPTEPANHALLYVAKRSLAANAFVGETELALPRGLPTGAAYYMPKRSELLGRYLKSAVREGAAIVPANLSAEPSVDAQDTRCLVSADFGSYRSVVHLLAIGGRVALACREPHGATCDGEREGRIVAITAGRDRAPGSVLVALDPARCADSTALVIAGLRSESTGRKTPPVTH